jgi:hypothetical protein
MPEETRLQLPLVHQKLLDNGLIGGDDQERRATGMRRIKGIRDPYFILICGVAGRPRSCGDYPRQRPLDASKEL